MNRLKRWTPPSVASLSIASLSVGACLPVVVALVRFIGRGVILDGDQAVFAMQAHDAATGGFPTMGLYSWNGWNHPGPIAFYLYAPFHWMSGGATWGILLATATWSIVTMLLVGWLSARRAAPRAAAPLIAGCLAVQLATWIAVGGAGVVDPWTPNLAVSLVVPFLLAAWGMAEGDRAATYLAVGLGAVAVQLHVGYAALVGLCVVVALIVNRRGGERVSGPTLARAAVLGGVLWLPVIADLVTDRTGNLAALARYFRAGVPTPAGPAEGMRIMAGEIGPWPTWITGPRPQGLFLEARQAPIALLLALVVAVAVVVVVRRTTASIIAASALVAATFASSQLRGFRYHYLVYWRAPIVLFAAGVAVAALIGTRRRVVAAVTGGALVIALVGATWMSARANQVTRYGDAIADLTGQLAARPVEGRVLLELGDGGVVGALPGILRDLEQRGVDIGVQPNIEWVVGDRGVDAATAATVWFVTDNGWALSLLARDPNGTVIASRSPYDAPTEARVRQLQYDIAVQLRAANRLDAIRALDSHLVAFTLDGIEGVDEVQVAELAELNQQLGGPGKRLGVVAFSPEVLPEVWWPLNAL